ncbi:phosphatidate cytidylyltransferase [Sphingomonas sp. MAH-20]|jgi:phosphatidate cytidylyltransferase|uniref:Phosphatidate cytidylyltransferase n=1 Tax=Sphingomonas horti TaxID=2682842 RepID=A0A6I4J2D8_9SPHN|nr:MULTISPECIES: phosphatidate cytidylyltransferase [Sphingomonas]MBA2919337.1 phosphatidate cytidylyltransferase [Sphingomonas sp. CGMCC 1.13658]MVO78218.1 phosphatidate cytidylyltransferase [Sphingomonas horti]
MNAARSGDLAVRTVSGIALIALALAALWGGGVWLWLLTSIAAMLMLAEWSDLVQPDPRQKRLAMFAGCVPLAIMSPLASGVSFFSFGLIIGTAFFVTIVTLRPRLGFGIAYVALPALALLFLRGRADGLLLALWTLATVWVTDIGAYFAGRSIGGPKLAPTVSPNKTWAGLIGGVASALILGLLLWQFAGLPPQLAFASPVLAVIAQIGDLYESWLKRQAGVKDSGTILPGHGGVLDRLDGLVPVAPAAAALILLDTLL